MEPLVDQIQAVPSSFWWGALGFLLGLIIGHWLHLGRDRRKERIEALRPIRNWVIAQCESPSAPITKPTNIELDAYASRIRKSKRVRLARAAVELKDSWTPYTDGANQLGFKLDPERYDKAMRELIALTRPE